MTPRERLRRSLQRRSSARDLAVHAPPPGRVFIRIGSVLAKTGLAQSSLYDLIARGEFPKPVPLSERRVAWLLDEVDLWIEQRIAIRDQRVKVKASSPATTDA